RNNFLPNSCIDHLSRETVERDTGTFYRGSEESMAKYLRCYLCSDLHAANRSYRKLLNAIKMNVYEAQVVLIAGDLIGKAIVPIIKQSNGRYTASFLDQHYLIDTEAELEKL